MKESLQSRAEQLAEEFASSATIDELNGLMRLMMKSGLERMLNTEMNVHLGRKGTAASTVPASEEVKRSGNRRNGRSQKTVQGELGEVTLSTPRERWRRSGRSSTSTGSWCMCVAKIVVSRSTRCTWRWA